MTSIQVDSEKLHALWLSMDPNQGNSTLQDVDFRVAL